MTPLVHVLNHQPRRRLLLLILTTCGVLPPADAKLDRRAVKYLDGRWQGLTRGTEGTLHLDSDRAAVFIARNGRQYELPYERITSLEYGQQVGRRVGVTLGLAAVLGVGALPVLFSKKRQHYLTVGYRDADGSPAGFVLELGKEVVRSTIKVLALRSGQKVRFDSAEARRHFGQ